VTARLLLVLAGASGTWALWLILGGGIDLHVAGRTITSNDPVRPLVLAMLAFIGYAWISGVHAVQQRLSRALDRIGDRKLAILIALGTTVVGIVYSATVGIASDGYGYVSEADLWIRRNPFIPEPLIGTAPWPRPEWTFAPLGYRPVLLDGAWSIVPVYSAGLPMIMAIAKILGGQEGMFWVVPVFGGLLTWMTYAVGRRLGSSRGGVIASWLVATSPPVLLMLMQPMSDVPVAAAWTTAIFFALGTTRRDVALCGLASALAILIRPNTAALAAVLGFWWLVRGDFPARSPVWRHRLAAAGLFAICALPGAAATAAIYQRLFGSPLTSGYGDLSGFFGWHHVLPNVRLYLIWFCESQSRLTLVGVAALCLPIRAVWPWIANRRALWMILGCLSLIVAQYLAYLEFDNWSFLRFVLTCWPFVMLGVASVAMLLMRSGKPIAALLVSATILALGVQGIQHARTSYVFRNWHAHRRHVDFAGVLARETPPASVFYTLNYSGTLRHYAGRSTLRADVLDADWLDRSVEWLKSRGFTAYLVLEDWELEWFKQRYAGQTIARTLDQRLTLIYASANPYYVYDLAGTAPAKPRFVEVGDLHALRSAPPDPAAFDPQLRR
jgi:hypothetical protein